MIKSIYKREIYYILKIGICWIKIEKEVKILSSYNQLKLMKFTWLLGIFNLIMINFLSKYLIKSPKIFTNQLLSILKLYHLHRIKTYKE